INGRSLDFWQTLDLVPCNREIDTTCVAMFSLCCGCGFGAIPLQSKEGCLREAQTGWSVQSAAHSLYKIAKRTLLIGTFDFEQTAPVLAARGHPRLTKAGNGTANFRHAWSMTARFPVEFDKKDARSQTAPPRD